MLNEKTFEKVKKAMLTEAPLPVKSFDQWCTRSELKYLCKLFEIDAPEKGFKRVYIKAIEEWVRVSTVIFYIIILMSHFQKKQTVNSGQSKRDKSYYSKLRLDIQPNTNMPEGNESNRTEGANIGPQQAHFAPRETEEPDLMNVDVEGSIVISNRSRVETETNNDHLQEPKIGRRQSRVDKGLSRRTTNAPWTENQAAPFRVATGEVSKRRNCSVYHSST
ncbi:hypothetical protein SCHPADRAFT_731090 [Schizopora paradoxa]|uniref:Uncharacterized protein n=1 Tax=Schizopora paradoxa TaxID=27342 RepID=A0A0H2R0Q1_9AGAM|nr:hypothetical protein SCHPADRAFT_731090 [Schizopora paradoxa]